MSLLQVQPISKVARSSGVMPFAEPHQQSARLKSDQVRRLKGLKEGIERMGKVTSDFLFLGIQSGARPRPELMFGGTPLAAQREANLHVSELSAGRAALYLAGVNAGASDAPQLDPIADAQQIRRYGGRRIVLCSAKTRRRRP